MESWLPSALRKAIQLHIWKLLLLTNFFAIAFIRRLILVSLSISEGSASTGPSSTDVNAVAEAFTQEWTVQPAEQVQITCDDRWQVYYRLRSLDIKCQCSGLEPLQVCFATPTEALQLWSILSSISQSRLMLADRLQRCWQLVQWADICIRSLAIWICFVAVSPILPFLSGRQRRRQNA